MTTENRLPPDQQLQTLGLNWERLERLAHKALADEKAERRITLDAYRDERAGGFLFDIGLAWAYRYQPDKANGVSYATSAYRRMRRRLPDYLRAEHGDSRTSEPLHQIPAGLMAVPSPIIADKPDESFEDLASRVSVGLTSRALLTLHSLARSMVKDGQTLREAADLHELEYDEASELLEELGYQMGHRPTTPEADSADTDFQLMNDWSVAA